MNRITASLAAIALLAVTSCSKPAAKPEGASSEAAPASSEASISIPNTFSLSPLQDKDNDIMGCQTMLSDGKAPGELFVEDGVEKGARGLLRVNGYLVSVDLLTNDQTEKGGTRTFADKDKTITVVETLTTGEQHPDSDSVDMSGTLTVTYKGITQTIPVTGGTAC